MQSAHEDKCSLTLSHCTGCKRVQAFSVPECWRWARTAGLDPQALGGLMPCTFHAQVVFLVLTRGDFLDFIIFHPHLGGGGHMRKESPSPGNGHSDIALEWPMSRVDAMPSKGGHLAPNDSCPVIG